MQINNRRIDEIKPYPKNAKKHPKKQVEQVAASIKAFGFNQPIVVDTQGVVIVGHGRLEAARLLQMTRVPVIVVDLDEDSAKAYRLADNKLNESDWEMDLVIEELKSLSSDMVDLTGFDSDLILDTTQDEPISLSDAPKARYGDLFQIGGHKLLCGDSTMPETYAKLFNNQKARMVFTDPPYGVDYIPLNGGVAIEKYADGGKIHNDDKTPTETLAFFEKVLANIYANTTDDANLYWWYASSLQHISQQALTKAGYHISQICIWLKNSLVYSQGQNFHRIYEPCIVAWKEGHPRYRDVNFSAYTELWEVDRKSFHEHLDVWYSARDKQKDLVHPTQKPVALAERAIKRSSEKGDIILDAFNGSGSTMVACEQLGRVCFGIEMEPKYVDAAVKRMLNLFPHLPLTVNGKEANREEWSN